MKDSTKHRKAALYDYVSSAVMTLELQPGADLDESALSEKFSLSRTPLREVFRELAGEGYLDLRENRGARVAEMSHVSVRDFFLAAPMIYGAVLRLAAQNATVAQIENLKAAQAEFRTALNTGSGVDRALANNRFHEITGEMAANVYLLPSFRRLLIDHARISMTFYRPSDGLLAENVAEASAQHDAIIAAIEAHDPDAAEQLAEDHWNLSRDQFELFVMPAPLDIPMGALPRTTPA